LSEYLSSGGNSNGKLTNMTDINSTISQITLNIMASMHPTKDRDCFEKHGTSMCFL
jgi:hypothetical protein